ncbi:MAG: argininosuccinate lyase [Armatimonadaceae bacterium]
MALWGGRFDTPTDALVWQFNQSLPFDRKMWREDITGSIAHARMLGVQGIIPAVDADALVAGLESLRDDIDAGKAELPPDAEDIHSAVEQLLRERLGPAVGGKLHTGRSRNDQVATDIRLWLRGRCDTLALALHGLRKQLVALAEANPDAILPGRTHHQHAQPVYLAHHLLAYFWMLGRDESRVTDARRRMNLLPLGAGALAGTPYPLNRHMVAEELSFDGVIENSMDAVGDRDFAIEVTAACSITMMHLSRFAEEIVLWMSPEFGFIELSDAVTTGSSIMPQKKNPDVAELIRGKSGRVYGDLVTLLTLMKGLVLAYNKDLQEDKEPLFDAVETTELCVTLMQRMLADAKFKKERMLASMHGDFSTATDLADALAVDGVPFREAHEIVGRVVRGSIEAGVGLEDLTIDDLKAYDSRFTVRALDAITPTASANARTSYGGTARASIDHQLVQARIALGI